VGSRTYLECGGRRGHVAGEVVVIGDQHPQRRHAAEGCGQGPREGVVLTPHQTLTPRVDRHGPAGRMAA
jgi:hypothetical protein